MIPRIKMVRPFEQYMLQVEFDDGKVVQYDVESDINELPGYMLLKTEQGLFENVRLDKSRTVVYWNADIDIPSDAIYEYGTPVLSESGSEIC